MWNYMWPAILIVGSNVTYHIITKGMPSRVNPFISLVVTYLIGATVALGMYYITSDGQGLKHSFSQLNWTSYALGFAVVGLELGYILLYRAGWDISVGSLVCNITMAVLLLAVGALFYKEALGMKQVAGALLCLCGLVLINMK
ncbi:MAG: EamA family transporter [Oscillospiraceae bacterium]